VVVVVVAVEVANVVVVVAIVAETETITEEKDGTKDDKVEIFPNRAIHSFFYMRPSTIPKKLLTLKGCPMVYSFHCYS
jgi:hypothetical protein